MANTFDVYLENLVPDLRDDLIKGYKTDPSLFLTCIDIGGFPVDKLSEKDSFKVIVHKFLSLCKLLNLQQLYQLFNTLHEDGLGLSSVGEAKIILYEALEETPKNLEQLKDRIEEKFKRLSNLESRPYLSSIVLNKIPYFPPLISDFHRDIELAIKRYNFFAKELSVELKSIQLEKKAMPEEKAIFKAAHIYDKVHKIKYLYLLHKEPIIRKYIGEYVKKQAGWKKILEIANQVPKNLLRAITRNNRNISGSSYNIEHSMV